MITNYTMILFVEPMYRHDRKGVDYPCFLYASLEQAAGINLHDYVWKCLHCLDSLPLNKKYE